jgi:serine protease Do
LVNISSSHHVPAGSGIGYPEAPEGSTLEDMFDDANPNSGQGQGALDEAESLGSGFVISPDGLIVTNNHVIAGADSIVVQLTDGSKFAARIVGTDDKTDLAVLRIDAGHPLKSVEFGDSDKAEIGDWVMAIGNPFGLGGSVTLGIVSARNRDIQTGPYDAYIQTDASINQGNSGGPLFDMNGKVVGINTAIVSRGGASLGIGFAVPANLARPVVDELAEYGEMRRGWIGIGIEQVTPDMAASLGLGPARGAMVIDVSPRGPADGVIEIGDLILEFGGRPVRTMHDLPRLVALAKVGVPTPVKLLRAGKQKVVTVIPDRLESPRTAIAAANASAAAPLAALPDTGGGPRPALVDLVGFDVAPIDAAARRQYAIDRGRRGVVIVSVVPGSDAVTKGLTPGATIDEVNQHKVGTVAELSDLVGEAREAGRPAVLFKVTDAAGISRFIAVRFRG